MRISQERATKHFLERGWNLNKIPKIGDIHNHNIYINNFFFFYVYDIFIIFKK